MPGSRVRVPPFPPEFPATCALLFPGLRLCASFCVPSLTQQRPVGVLPGRGTRTAAPSRTTPSRLAPAGASAAFPPGLDLPACTGVARESWNRTPSRPTALQASRPRRVETCVMGARLQNTNTYCSCSRANASARRAHRRYICDSLGPVDSHSLVLSHMKEAPTATIDA